MNKWKSSLATLFLSQMICISTAWAAVVQYNVSGQGYLFSPNLQFLGLFADTTNAVYLPEYDVFSAAGASSGSFQYDNQASGYLALSNTIANIGSYQATSILGGIFVGDNSFNPSVPFDPNAPLVDAISLHLGNFSTPGFSGFSVGDWTLDAIAASWFGGEFISNTDNPDVLSPSGFEQKAFTFIFTNSSGETAFVSSDMQVTPVPLPAGVWLFASALLGVVSLRRKK